MSASVEARTHDEGAGTREATATTPEPPTGESKAEVASIQNLQRILPQSTPDTAEQKSSGDRRMDSVSAIEVPVSPLSYMARLPMLLAYRGPKRHNSGLEPLYLSCCDSAAWNLWIKTGENGTSTVALFWARAAIGALNREQNFDLLESPQHQ